jgi:hypothetical protein
LYLLPEENIEWVTQKGLFSISLFLSLVVAFIGIFPAIFGFFGGESNGVPFPPNPAVGWLGVVLILVALGCAIFLIVETEGTKYVLTNKRMVVTRFGKVVKEISLSSFMGKPVSQFVDKTAAAMMNNQPVYNVRITNPESWDSIEFKSLSETAVEKLENILEQARQMVRCKYCSSINPANSLVCARCGAPLQ